MKKTILLKRNGLLNSNISKWVLTLSGLLYSMIGIGILVRTPTSIWGWGLIMIGLLQVVYTFIMYDQRSAFAPKCIIDEDSISIRESVFGQTKVINWKEIKLIAFKSFTLEFQLNDEKTQRIILQTNAETSVEIKKALREIAEKKLINVKQG